MLLTPQEEILGSSLGFCASKKCLRLRLRQHLGKRSKAPDKAFCASGKLLRLRVRLISSQKNLRSWFWFFVPQKNI